MNSLSLLSTIHVDPAKYLYSFGFLDGVSEPRIVGIPSKPHPDGEKPARQGIFLVGRDGDQISNRPAWTLDGSFLAFRFLPQLVPEFNKFLKDNPIPGVLPPSRGSELLGARLVGRWKSGRPKPSQYQTITKEDTDIYRCTYRYYSSSR